ncbi:hypothetical protein PQQ75_04150 [Paraburkholderia aspalathi]|uniref:hypothetical protein n=1 Tax=Paraburkholderia aspalathi TaxID=1324617 RepID=UPI0038BA92C0
MLALDVALILEQYTRACVQMMEDGGEARSQAGYLHSYNPLKGIDMPSLTYPSSIVWKGLDRSLVAELRELPNAYEAARRRIYVASEYDDPIDGMWNEEVEAARLGQRAWALAVKVRQRYELRPAENHERDGWDIHKTLADKIEDDKERQKRIEAQDLKMQSEISAAFDGDAEPAPDRTSPT